MYRFNDSTIDNRIKEIVYSGDAQYSCHLTIEGYEVPVSQISNIHISKPIIDTSKEYFYIGTFISNKIIIKFRNLDGLQIESGNNVDLNIGLNVDGTERIIPIGRFQIDELSENYYETCEITCLDDSTKFKPAIDYSSCFTDGKATIAEILNYICTFFDVELDPNYPTTNDNIEIGTYDSSVSGKQWISYIAELKGCNAKIGRDGKLYFIPLKSASVASINALAGKSWVLGEKYEISGVTYFDAIRNISFGTDDDNILFIRQDNPFIVDETAVSNIYDEVVGTIIWNLTTENYGDITIDSGDTLEQTLGNEIYKTVYNGDILYEITIMDKNEVKIPSKKQEVTTNVLNSELVNRKKIETTIDQLQGQVVINAENIQTTRDELTNNYSTTSQINTMIINAESGITNTFSEAGGNNVLRNTRFFAQEVLEQGQVYEYWYGNVERTTNDNAANGFSILLQDNLLYQTQNVANGNYTLSFAYNKTNPLATCKVIINETEYELDGSGTFQTGVDDIAPIQINSNQITVGFSSTIANACEIYDIMLNAGAVKLAYSQNQNETITNTVNISKGITIDADGENVRFVAVPRGISVKNKTTNADVVFFKDTGMVTDNAKINYSAEIVGIYRQKVGDQIWDSML